MPVQSGMFAVLSSAATAHPGLGGPFLILEFDSDLTIHRAPGEPSGSAFLLEEDEDIVETMLALQHLQQITLSPDDSLVAETVHELA